MRGVKLPSSRWSACGLVLILMAPALAGCDRSSKTKPAQEVAVAEPCKEATQRLEKQQEELQKLNQASPPSAEVLERQRKVFEAMAQRCAADKWPAEAIACVGRSRSVADLRKCDAELSDEQRDNLRKALAGAFGVEP
jgi:hypothetical protein